MKNIKEILAKVKEKAKETKHGEWIRGINYNQLKLEEKRHISREELDEVAPNNPVIIPRLTGHMYLLNSKGIEVAGITKDTPDPDGGFIERNEKGEPTGLLHGLAGTIALSKLPPYTVEDIKWGLRKVYDNYSAWGITSVHDPGTTSLDMRAYKQLLDEGVKKVRVQMILRTHRESPRTTLEEMIALGIESGFGNDWLKVMSLKIMGDGTGSGGTAGVYIPQKRGDSLGLFMTSPDEMKDITVKAHNHGIRVCIHSIGDRAIAVALDAIEATQKAFPISDMRHRIEHNNICTINS